jgi:hypothetical protein
MPAFVALRATRVRDSRPAPQSSTTVSATWPTTSAWRTRGAWVTLAPVARIHDAMEPRSTINAGTRPTTRPVVRDNSSA